MLGCGLPATTDNPGLQGQWDGASRYRPSIDERRACCDDIRTQSKAYPYSLWAHVHSAAHVAALHDVDPANVRRAAKLLTRLPELEEDGASTAEHSLSAGTHCHR
jgi:hypothetical protein